MPAQTSRRAEMTSPPDKKERGGGYGNHPRARVGQYQSQKLQACDGREPANAQ